MKPSGALEAVRRILRHLRRDPSLSAFEIPRNTDVIVGSYRVGSLGLLKILSIPSVRPPEHWGRVLLSGVFRRRAALFKGKRIIEVGAGSGWISIALAKFARAKRIFSLDLTPEASVITQINAILNGVESRVAPDLNGPVDHIVGNIPQLAPRGLRPRGKPLDGYASRVGEDLRSLELAAALLETSLPHLRDGGSIILNVNGRAAFDVLRWLFAKWRFVGRLIHRERVQQDAMASIEPLMRAEQQSGRRFNFYDMYTATRPITATQAFQRMLQGDPVWHDLYVIEARSYRDVLRSRARKAIPQLKRIGRETLPELRIELARYWRGFCRLDVKPEDFQIAAPQTATSELPVYSRHDSTPRRPPREGTAVDLAKHFHVPELRLSVVFTRNPPPPPSTLSQIGLLELLKVLNRKLWLNVEQGGPAADDVIRMDAGESEWLAPLSAVRGARRMGTVRDVQTAAARYLSRSRGWRIKPDQVIVGPGARALIDATLRAMKASNVLLPVPYSGGIRSLDHKFTPVLTRRVGDELAIELPSQPGVLLISQPNNPTGLYYSESAVREIEKHLVLLDESLAMTGDGYRRIEHKVLYAGLSKEFGLEGLRVGFAVTSDASLRRAIRRELSHEPDPWSLGAAAAVLGRWKPILKRHRENYLRPRLAMLERTLKELGIPYIPPSGGLSMWVDFDAVWLGRRWSGYNLKGKKIAKPCKITRENFRELLRQAAWLTVTEPEWAGVPRGPYRVTFAIDRLPEAVDRLRAFALSVEK